MAMYYAASTTHVVKDRFFPWYLGWSARTTGTVLHAMGYTEVEVEGNAVVSRRGQRRGAISVERGCDAVQPSALFVSAVLASPVPLVSRLGARRFRNTIKVSSTPVGRRGSNDAGSVPGVASSSSSRNRAE